MRKYYLLIILLIIFLSACGGQQPSEEIVQTAIMQTNIALTPTESEDQITDAMIQTAIAETQTANPTQVSEQSSTPKNTQTPNPTSTQTEVMEEETQVIAGINLEGYPEDFLNNEVVGFRVFNIEYPSNFDLYDLQEGNSVVKFEAEFANVSGESQRINFSDLYIIDSDGYKYEIEKSITDDYRVDLLANEKVRSYFYGQIPSETTPEFIRFMDDDFSTIHVELTQIPSDHESIELSLRQNTRTEQLGSVAEADGYKAFAISMDNPFNDGQSYSGYKNIRVEWSLENATSDTPLEFDTTFSEIYLVDTEGYIYPLDPYLAIFNDGIDDISLAKGEKVKGYVFFRIYEEATPSYIRFENLYIGLN